MRPEHEHPNWRHQKGFALIVVIWVGVLLALMAAAFSSAVRSRLRSTAGEAETVQSEALADAGVKIALLDLLQPAAPKTRRFTADGTPVACGIGTQGAVLIQVEDEAGKVNLNTANEEILIALFTGLGAGRLEARKFTDRILDFRDIDTDKRSDGAEREDYKKAGNPVGPKNSDFSSVDELDQVLNIPPELRDRAKPFLTTLSSQNGIDPHVAPKGLKPLLARGTSDILSNIQTDSDGSSIFNSGELPPQFVSASSHNGYTIRAEAFLPAGARYVSEAIVELPNGATGAPVFRQWRRGTSRLPVGQAPPVLQQLPPC